MRRAPSRGQTERFLELVGGEGLDPATAARAIDPELTASRFRGLASRDLDFGRRYGEAKRTRRRLLEAQARQRSRTRDG